MENDKAKWYRIGVTVLILLAALTIGEFFLGAVASVWAAPIILIALIKAFLIIRDYMHLSRVFTGDEELH